MENPDFDRAAERMLEKVRHFASSLDAEERALFAALLAPGVAAAWVEDDEVEGFGTVWSTTRVQRHLHEAVRKGSLRIEGM